MLYFVECRFTHPDHEQAWNDFYSHDKLPALISVSGFSSSQRFRLVRGTAPPYLAIHTIRDAAVLDSAEYRDKGGGNFARWQSYITDWSRNVYDGAAAPLPASTECLLLTTDAATAAHYGLHAIHAVALDKNPNKRWLGKIAAERAAAIPADAAIDIYQPMADALTRASV